MSEANGRAPESLLDRLRARATELAEEQHLDLEVPGYDDLLLVRYGPPTAAAFARMSMLLASGGGRDEDYAQILLGSCRDVLVREEPDAPSRPIDPSGPRRFDAPLAEMLGIQAQSGAQVLAGVFGPSAGVGQHAMALFFWSGGVKADVEEALAGESEGRPS